MTEIAGIGVKELATITETEVDPLSSLDDLRDKLRKLHLTGKIIVHLATGGTQRVTVEVRKKLRVIPE